MIDLEKEPVEISCPECGQAIQVTVQDAKQRKVVHCTGCGADIHLSPDDDLEKNIRKANKSIKDFENTVKNFNIKFKL